jgi:ABC-type branched-subunit amino acid transport system substrate-binding protein
VVTEDAVATDVAANYDSLASKIVQAKPDCLALIVYSDVGAQLLKDLKKAIAADTANAAHWNNKFFVSGTDGVYDDVFIPAGLADPADNKSANATEGAFGTTIDPAPDSTEYKAFANLYKAQHGRDPGPYASQQFDAAVLLALAVQKAGTATDGTKIRDALFDVSKGGTAFGPTAIADAIAAIKNNLDVDYKGASGAVDFDDYGNVVGDYVIWRVVKGTDGTYSFSTIARIKATELQ